MMSNLLRRKSTYAATLYFLKSAKIALAIFAILLLQSCEMLFQNDTGRPAPVTIVDQPELCTTPLQNETFDDFCSLDRWLSFVLEFSDVAWSERSTIINELKDDARSALQKILLSQATDTPYQQRLRAQNWIVKISADTSQTMSDLLNELIYQNSQQLLEFESAITILSRVNVRQNKTILELQQQLEARESEIKVQQEQVEQLLKIETDLIEQNRSEKR